MAAEKALCFIVVVATLMMPLANSMDLECNIQINPEQVVGRCAQFVNPYLDDPQQEALIELFYNFIEVAVGNSTEIPKASDKMKSWVATMALCFSQQLLLDNPKLLALAFDCMVENPLPAGSTIDDATKCSTTTKTAECVKEKAEKLCPSESGSRARRAVSLLAGSQSLLAHV